MTPVEYIQAGRERFVAELCEFLRFPSVSTEPARAGDVRRCCDWLAGKLRDLGFAVEVVPTAGHPAILAGRCRAPGRRTFLVYGHYDVQPAEPLDLWKSAPFEPTVRDGKVFARGAVDDKGQVTAHVQALEAYLRTVGELPVNVKLIIEGEEEIGSPNLEPLLEARKAQLACDYVVVSDTAMFAPGVPSICEGLRGLVYHDVLVRGPKQDLHSGGFGGIVVNPANALATLIADLKTDDGRITVPGFYDAVRPPAEQRRREWAELERTTPESYWTDYLQVDELRGEPGLGLLERKWARPTLDVCGLWSGYQGAGSKTIIPAYAGAKISMRLVPDQEPEPVADAFEAHARRVLERHFGRAVKVEFHRYWGAHPVLVPTDTPGMKAAVRAIERGFGRKPVFIRSGGTIPVVRSFKDRLGADSLLMGYGSPDDNAHGPNEKFDLGDFHRGMLSNAHFWEEAAAL
jgi:acetylornithine deacetylase/succinyl-diaminopimelate desuccinylase-like protein